MKLTKHEKTALVLAMLPFVVQVGDRAVKTVDGVSSVFVLAVLPFALQAVDRVGETVNGVATVLWDYNYAGVVLGLVALLVIYMGVRDLYASQEYRPEPCAPHYAICAPIALLAIYQLAKGAFLI